jgi:hypothetical protein
MTACLVDHPCRGFVTLEDRVGYVARRSAQRRPVGFSRAVTVVRQLAEASDVVSLAGSPSPV